MYPTSPSLPIASSTQFGSDTPVSRCGRRRLILDRSVHACTPRAGRTAPRTQAERHARRAGRGRAARDGEGKSTDDDDPQVADASVQKARQTHERDQPEGVREDGDVEQPLEGIVITRSAGTREATRVEAAERGRSAAHPDRERDQKRRRGVQHVPLFDPSREPRRERGGLESEPERLAARRPRTHGLRRSRGPRWIATRAVDLHRPQEGSRPRALARPHARRTSAPRQRGRSSVSPTNE